MQLLLMRHFEPQIPQGPKRYIGQTDYPLSPAGRIHAENSGYPITSAYGKITRICSSPLLRCSQGAQILGNQWQCPITYMDSLREIHMGVWENIPISQIQEQFPQEYQKRGLHMDSYAPPGGETFSQVQARALEALRQICPKDSLLSRDTVLLMTHAGVIRSLLCCLDSRPLTALFEYRISYGEIISLSNPRNLHPS